MDRFLFFIVLVICLGACHPPLQNSTKYFGKYAAFLAEGEKEIGGGYFYLLAHKTGDQYVKRVFFPETMTLTSEESYAFDSTMVLNGPAQYYTDEGQKLEEGQFINDEKSGPWRTYHRSNGIIASEGPFFEGLKEGPWKFYDSKGNLKEEVSYEDNRKNGAFRMYDSRDTVINYGFYKADTIFQQSHVLEKDYNRIFEKCDEMPYMASCKSITNRVERAKCSEKALLTNIYHRLHYPREAREMRLQGRVVAQFVITKNGEIQDLNVVKGINQLFKDEVLKTLSEMPEWKPGKQDGQAVNVLFTLPISFKLGI